MNRTAKEAILTAYGKGIISKIEVHHLFQSGGRIILDLSSEGSTNPINDILEKIPDLKDHFTPIIYLGNGKKPE